MSKIKKYLKGIKKFSKTITTSKKAREFLISTGIYNKEGKIKIQDKNSTG